MVKTSEFIPMSMKKTMPSYVSDGHGCFAIGCVVLIEGACSGLAVDDYCSISGLCGA